MKDLLFILELAQYHKKQRYSSTQIYALLLMPAAWIVELFITISDWVCSVTWSLNGLWSKCYVLKWNAL